MPKRSNGAASPAVAEVDSRFAKLSQMLAEERGHGSASSPKPKQNLMVKQPVQQGKGRSPTITASKSTGSDNDDDDDDDIDEDEFEDDDEDDQFEDEDEDELSHVEDDDQAEDDQDDQDQEDDDNDHDQDGDGDGDGEEELAEVSGKKHDKKRPVIEATSVESFNEKVAKSGVLYLSRVPPHMKPDKIRHLLQIYGAIGRVFLQPEDPEARKRRIKKGGNKKKNFSEGWIEFADKGVAKSVAASLNGTMIGGKKSSFYHDDLWLLKYLPKFKWHHLTEQIAYENAVRDQRLRTELAQSKRENNFFMENVDKSKKIREVESRKFAKKRQADDGEDDAPSAVHTSKKSRSEADDIQAHLAAAPIVRTFRQKQAVPEPEERTRAMDHSVLARVFSNGKSASPATTKR
ncbi:pre-rRNA-processing protein esf-2 [Capsaspora owczarzaki ATCC 30864]|uniref:Pre-rRNA-processing protein esf-2 n=1 Tax=Capsaspora owczarzaki (strain ATCC 30864) TaxID=595528 RepID=A0A0D2X2P7_CAPO3|nr:pre-rRNA-processing protein esf-2 [Capsaspora owczarzaki ATCC 30864]KJE92929.1 pre-rRNA-processing protein esf-2 [Capsaspora owczarzaki ATCC 30864]|eukprot:XP_004363539.1 pre-rRNA-processing protein esf-2 [Capsaspora owczarzaki ATCC 30864]